MVWFYEMYLVQGDNMTGCRKSFGLSIRKKTPRDKSAARVQTLGAIDKLIRQKIMKKNYTLITADAVHTFLAVKTHIAALKLILRNRLKVKLES
jgi:predicted PilT family ATPase